MEKRNNKPVLYVVVPCYMDQEVLYITANLYKERIEKLIREAKISADSRILFINDGSTDDTWEIIKKLSVENSMYLGLNLSRNFGHQGALLAGLMAAKNNCDITISIDSDGQDDIAVFDMMIEEYYKGNEIVYGVRSKRDTDHLFKKITATGYYKALKAMGVEVIYNHADCRLVSKRVLEIFSDYTEVNMYMRGLFPLIGFKSSCVFYDRNERIAGEGHYTLSKLMTLAIDGITSLSVKPIRIITSIGFIISLLSFLLIIWVFISLALERVVPGWASSVLAICMIGGIQLISLGVIGEYVGKIYLESKHRPRFIIEEATDKRLSCKDKH